MAIGSSSALPGKSRIVSTVLQRLEREGFHVTDSGMAALIRDAQAFSENHPDESSAFESLRRSEDVDRLNREVNEYVELSKRVSVRIYNSLYLDAGVVKEVRAACGPRRWGC
jgi:hypothetical protein